MTGFRPYHQRDDASDAKPWTAKGKKRQNIGNRPLSTKWELEFEDTILPCQFFQKNLIKESETADQKIAWRKFQRDICDVAYGPPKQRLSYIREIQNWMRAKDALYPFDFWCENLQLDPDYVWKILTKFLRECREDAIKGHTGNKIVRGVFDCEGQDQRQESARTAMLAQSHLVQRISEGCFGCARCERVGEWEDFEDSICEKAIKLNE